jgi:hypothetical protein
MTLPPGSRLGPYEVVGALGAGGMGEVYQARDPRLGRDVAIKVLPVDVANDPDRLARFEREAKAVSALNHPNIVTLYEVGTSDSSPYLVLERVDGQSLLELIYGGPLPIRKLVDLGAQIAAGLAKAHVAGIVHRDLKPENVMVTNDGFAKILDFGLARLVWPDEGLGEAADTATFVKETTSGAILGTPGYLSPEQAAGKPADYRADQFAFGALLYEMATGVRPFKRASMPESLTATIREEPEPVRSKRTDLPAPLAWLIERSLAKHPDDRYASTKDLARDLADIRDRLSEISRVPDVKMPERRSRVVRSRLVRWALALAAVAALVASAFVFGRRTAVTPVTPVPSFQPLTFERGVITGARFSPDGRRVYYSASFGSADGASHVFVTDLDQTESRRLEGLPAGLLLGVSSKNVLAILETPARQCCGASGILTTVPAIGGTPQKRMDDVKYADWGSDGQRIVIDRADGCQYLGDRIITKRCAWVRASPVGDDVVFKSDDGLTIQNAAGKRLDFKFKFIYGLTWSGDGREVWFTGSETDSPNDRALYALSLDGRSRLVARTPGAITIHDIARDGSALISTGAGWFGINTGTDGQDERTLDLYGRSHIVALSADGQWLLVNEDREGAKGAWLKPTNGKPPVHLDGVARGLSPDGRFALIQIERDGQPTRLVLQPTGVGQSVGQSSDVRVPPDLGISALADHASWSSDAKWLFMPLLKRRSDELSKTIYRYEGDGRWRPVTPEGVDGRFIVSPDGEQIVTTASGVLTRYWVDGRPPEAIDGEQGRPVHWTPDGRLLLQAAREPFPARLYHRDLVSGRTDLWRTLVPADATGVSAIGQVLTDGTERSYVYEYVRGLNDLFLARGWR